MILVLVLLALAFLCDDSVEFILITLFLAIAMMASGCAVKPRPFPRVEVHHYGTPHKANIQLSSIVDKMDSKTREAVVDLAFFVNAENE